MSETSPLRPNYRQLSTSIKRYETAVSNAREKGDRHAEEVALTKLGEAYEEWGKNDKAKELYKIACAIAEEIGDTEGQGICHLNLGGLHESSGEYRKAHQEYQYALDLAKSSQDIQIQGMATINLGGVWEAYRRYDEAEMYYKEGLYLARKANDKPREGIALIKIAGVRRAKKQFRRAKEYYEQGSDISKGVKDYRTVGIATINLGRLFHSWAVSQRSRGKKYETLFEDAKNYLSTGKEIASMLGDTKAEKVATSNLAKLDNEIGEREIRPLSRDEEAFLSFHGRPRDNPPERPQRKVEVKVPEEQEDVSLGRGTILLEPDMCSEAFIADLPEGGKLYMELAQVEKRKENRSMSQDDDDDEEWDNTVTTIEPAPLESLFVNCPEVNEIDTSRNNSLVIDKTDTQNTEQPPLEVTSRNSTASLENKEEDRPAPESPTLKIIGSLFESKVNANEVTPISPTISSKAGSVAKKSRNRTISPSASSVTRGSKSKPKSRAISPQHRSPNEQNSKLTPSTKRSNSPVGVLKSRSVSPKHSDPKSAAKSKPKLKAKPKRTGSPRNKNPPETVSPPNDPPKESQETKMSSQGLTNEQPSTEPEVAPISSPQQQIEQRSPSTSPITSSSYCLINQSKSSIISGYMFPQDIPGSFIESETATEPEKERISSIISISSEAPKQDQQNTEEVNTSKRAMFVDNNTSNGVEVMVKVVRAELQFSNYGLKADDGGLYVMLEIGQENPLITSLQRDCFNPVWDEAFAVTISEPTEMTITLIYTCNWKEEDEPGDMSPRMPSVRFLLPNKDSIRFDSASPRRASVLRQSKETTDDSATNSIPIIESPRTPNTPPIVNTPPTSPSFGTPTVTKIESFSSIPTVSSPVKIPSKTNLTQTTKILTSTVTPTIPTITTTYNIPSPAQVPTVLLPRPALIPPKARRSTIGTSPSLSEVSQRRTITSAPRMLSSTQPTNPSSYLLTPTIQPNWPITTHNYNTSESIQSPYVTWPTIAHSTTWNPSYAPSWGLYQSYY